MKKALLTLIGVFLLAAPAYPYWLWTPKTGKWVNPKETVASTPKGQLQVAKDFYDAGKFEDAKREFRKILRAYNKSAEAAESQFYIGMIEEKQGNLFEAYKAYQLVVEKYPFSERIGEINEREFAIAEQFMSGEKRKAMGVPLPVENPAIEIFSKIVENAPYGPLAAKAQYKLGLVLKGLSRLAEAEEAFTKVVTNYPESEWAEPAKFQLANTKAGLARNADYDQGATREAKEQFEDFVKSNPDAELSKEAEKNINRLKDKESESDYNAGRFYEKQKQFDSAKIYYEGIIKGNPDSAWAARALERMNIMENRKK